MKTGTVSVTRCGWRGFEGWGLPWEGWAAVEGGGWRSAGRALTQGRAAVKALRLAEVDRENPAQLRIVVDDEVSGDRIVAHARRTKGIAGDPGVWRGAAPEGARIEIGSDRPRPIVVTPDEPADARRWEGKPFHGGYPG